MGDHALQAGELQQELVRLEDQVRNEPAAAKHRVYLFQLLVVLGRWERALTQLRVLEELDAAMIPMASTYRTAIGCEMLRAEVFAGRRSPIILGEPDRWTALLIEAMRALADGKPAAAARLRAEAFAAAPATAGAVDGEPFTWLVDADSRLGPVLEVILNGRYGWAPLHRVSRIVIEPPADLRDVVWMPAQFTWSNGGEGYGLIPARYPGTEGCEDGRLLLARRTEWENVGDDTFVGRGQRMFATDAGEYALMDMRLVEFAPAVSAEEPHGAADADHA